SPSSQLTNPCFIAEMSNDRLDQQACEWCRNPQYGYLRNLSSQRLEDTADISVLQAKGKLDTEEAYTHIDYLRNTQCGLPSGNNGRHKQSLWYYRGKLRKICI